MDIPALRAAIQREMPAALALLREWTAINSFTFNAAGVNALGHETAAAFEPLGFAAEYVPCADSRCGNHLFLRRAGTSRALLLCVSHLDTVFPPEEEARNRFRWREEAGRVYGPGVVDIKGGTALLWLQLRVLRALNPQLFGHFNWIVALNSAEEVLGADFADATLARYGDRATAALVYESGACREKEFNVVVARKGRAQFQVVADGRGAHAGSKHADGANAIAELANIIPKIEALTDPSLEVTANVGTIRGGEALNRVPHEAVAEGELRAFDPDTLHSAEEAILRLAGPGKVAAAADGFRCQVRAKITGRTHAWPEQESTRRLFDVYTRAAKKMEARVVTEKRGGLSDGNLLAPHLPTLDGLGPAGGNAHASEWSDDPLAPKRPEYLLLDSLAPKALLNLLAVEEMAAKF